MKSIRAFVGHSFTDDDADLVKNILAYLTVISNMHPIFTWEHAKHAEPKNVSEKVLALLEDKNLFIGICTKKERVVASSELSSPMFKPNHLCGAKANFHWKTSDWIIQEIGLAVGRGLNVILLVEEGLRAPGALQGNLEYIEFNKLHPEKCYHKLLEMITALSPKKALASTGELEASTTTAQTTLALQSRQESQVSVTPQPNWKRKDYESAFINLAIEKDEGKARQISEQYLATADADHEGNRQAWYAFTEYVSMLFDMGGSLPKLQALALENPLISEIHKYLGFIYFEYNNYKKAGIAFEQAAKTTNDVEAYIQLIGEAACAYQEAGDKETALSLIAAMKQQHGQVEKYELNILKVEERLSTLKCENELLLGTLERILDIDPTDHDARYGLAYKYSEMGSEDLAVFHYSRIPPSKRSSAVWNNLGVSFERLHMPAKSVSAYRKAQEGGNTLANSNLAIKLENAGFLSEAKAVCEAALTVADCHKNVDITLARLKDMTQEEDKKETELVEKVKPISEFYKKFGEAITKPSPSKLAAQWVSSDCILSVTFDGKTLHASGSYERLQNGLFGIGFPDSSAASKQAKTLRYQVDYHGTLRGRTIVGTVVRKYDGEKEKMSSLLSAGIDEPTVLMAISDDEHEILVLEKKDSFTPRFYRFTRKDSDLLLTSPLGNQDHSAEVIS